MIRQHAILSAVNPQTFEPFWHKSNVICQAVQGNLGGARFAADILAANGIDDPVFFGLVDEILNNKPANEVMLKARIQRISANGCGESRYSLGLVGSATPDGSRDDESPRTWCTYGLNF